MALVVRQVCPNLVECVLRKGVNHLDVAGRVDRLGSDRRAATDVRRYSMPPFGIDGLLVKATKGLVDSRSPEARALWNARIQTRVTASNKNVVTAFEDS